MINYPLDYDAAQKNPMEFVAVATEAVTGQARYFSKDDITQDDYSIMKASSAIPFACHPYPVNGTLYYDGALSDPVPIKKAFQMGCDKVILLLTLPEDTIRSSDKDKKLAARIRKKYPMAAEKLCLRAQRYNEDVSQAKSYAAEGKILIISPDDTCNVSTLSRDADALCRLYKKGYRAGEKILPFLSNN